MKKVNESISHGFLNYYMYYISEFKSKVVLKEVETYCYYEEQFPSSEAEMLDFIKSFTKLFPDAENVFEQYIPLINALNMMQENEDFRNTSLYLDYVDYIREHALSDLEEQIKLYSITEKKRSSDCIKYIKELNEELGVIGKNSYIYENDNEIEVGIEAPGHTVSVAVLDKETLISEIENDEWKDYIINEYLTSLRYFDIDYEMDQDWFDELKNTHTEAPSKIRYMIENDIEYFKEQLYVKRFMINNF